jgi:hypothetical protein
MLVCLGVVHEFAGGAVWLRDLSTHAALDGELVLVNSALHSSGSSNVRKPFDRKVTWCYVLNGSLASVDIRPGELPILGQMP